METINQQTQQRIESKLEQMQGGCNVTSDTENSQDDPAGDTDNDNPISKSGNGSNSVQSHGSPIGNGGDEESKASGQLDSDRENVRPDDNSNLSSSSADSYGESMENTESDEPTGNRLLPMKGDTVLPLKSNNHIESVVDYSETSESESEKLNNNENRPAGLKAFCNDHGRQVNEQTAAAKEMQLQPEQEQQDKQKQLEPSHKSEGGDIGKISTNNNSNHRAPSVEQRLQRIPSDDDLALSTSGPSSMHSSLNDDDEDAQEGEGGEKVQETGTGAKVETEAAANSRIGRECRDGIDAEAKADTDTNRNRNVAPLPLPLPLPAGVGAVGVASGEKVASAQMKAPGKNRRDKARSSAMRNGRQNVDEEEETTESMGSLSPKVNGEHKPLQETEYTNNQAVITKIDKAEMQNHVAVKQKDEELAEACQARASTPTVPAMTESIEPKSERSTMGDLTMTTTLSETTALLNSRNEESRSSACSPHSFYSNTSMSDQLVIDQPLEALDSDSAAVKTEKTEKAAKKNPVRAPKPRAKRKAKTSNEAQQRQPPKKAKSTSEARAATSVRKVEANGIEKAKKPNNKAKPGPKRAKAAPKRMPRKQQKKLTQTPPSEALPMPSTAAAAVAAGTEAASSTSASMSSLSVTATATATATTSATPTPIPVTGIEEQQLAEQPGQAVQAGEPLDDNARTYCILCTQWFENSADIVQHITKCMSERSGVKMVEKYQLTQGQESPSKSGCGQERIYKCKLCSTHHEAWHLFLHMYNEHKAFICTYCFRFFSSAEKLTLHLEVEHDVEQQHFQDQQHLLNSVAEWEERYMTCCTCMRTVLVTEEIDHDCLDYMSACDECGLKGRHSAECPEHPNVKRAAKMKKKRAMPRKTATPQNSSVPAPVSTEPTDPSPMDVGGGDDNNRPASAVPSDCDRVPSTPSGAETAPHFVLPPPPAPLEGHAMSAMDAVPYLQLPLPSHVANNLIDPYSLQPTLQGLPPDRNASFGGMQLLVPKIKLCVPKEFQKSVNSDVSTTETEEEEDEDEAADSGATEEERAATPTAGHGGATAAGDSLHLLQQQREQQQHVQQMEVDDDLRDLREQQSQIERLAEEIKRTKMDIELARTTKHASKKIAHRKDNAGRGGKWSPTPPTSPNSREGTLLDASSQQEQHFEPQVPAAHPHHTTNDGQQPPAEENQSVSVSVLPDASIKAESKAGEEQENDKGSDIEMSIERGAVVAETHASAANQALLVKEPAPEGDVGEDEKKHNIQAGTQLPTEAAQPPDEEPKPAPIIEADASTPAVAIQLERPLSDIDQVTLMRIFLRATSPTCLYCNHARRIAVNGKQLVLHMIAEHRFTATVPGAAEVAAGAEAAGGVEEKAEAASGVEEKAEAAVGAEGKSEAAGEAGAETAGGEGAETADGAGAEPPGEPAAGATAESRAEATAELTADPQPSAELSPALLTDKLKSMIEPLEKVFFNLYNFNSMDEQEDVRKFNERIFECFCCRLSTTVHKELYLHNRKEHIKAALLCQMCCSSFYSFSELLCHQCPGTPINMIALINYRCCLCNKSNIPSAFRLMVHLRKRHFTCDICLEDCSNQYGLSNHVWKHKLHHLCYRCSITYRSKEDITKHLFWKHGTESINCKHCLQKRWRHVYHFCIPPESFECDECLVRFSKATFLKVHKRLHTADFRYPCTEPDCDKKFVSRRLLLKHAVEHKPPEPQETLPTNSSEPQALAKVGEDAAGNKADVADQAAGNVPGTVSAEGDASNVPDPALNAGKGEGATTASGDASDIQPASKKSKDDFDFVAPNLSESDSDGDGDSDSEASKKNRVAMKSERDGAEKAGAGVPGAEDETTVDNDEEEDEKGVDDEKKHNIWRELVEYQKTMNNSKAKEKNLELCLDDSFVPEPIRLHVAISDHDYVRMFEPKLNKLDPKWQKPPTPKKPTEQIRLSSSSSSGSSSSEASSSSDSDDSSKSSCSSSSSGSSSSSSDSDSSAQSTNSKKRLLKKSERDRARHISKSVSPKKRIREDDVEIKVDDDGPPEALASSPALPPSPSPPEPKEPEIRESDLDTAESDTDEDFYDEHPQKVERSREQIALSQNSSRPTTPSLPEDEVAKENRMKPKKRRHDRKSPLRMQVNNGAAPQLLMTPNQEQFASQLYHQSNNMHKDYQSPLVAGMVPGHLQTPHGISEGSSCSDVDGPLKRSKRQRRPNRFYGYETEDVPDVSQPVMMGMRAMKPQPPPNLTWCKDDLPSPSKSIFNRSKNSRATQRAQVTDSENSAISGGSAPASSRRKRRTELPRKRASKKAKTESQAAENKYPPIPTLKIRPSQLGLAADAQQSSSPEPSQNASLPKKQHRSAQNRTNSSSESDNEVVVDNQESDQNEASQPVAPRPPLSPKRRFNQAALNQYNTNRLVERNLETVATDVRPTPAVDAQIATGAPDCPNQEAPVVMKVPHGKMFGKNVPPALLPNPDAETLEYFHRNGIRYPIRPPSGARKARDSEAVYCYCRCPYDEVSEMIACDGLDCIIEWFHFECVGILLAPSGPWYCAECRSKKFGGHN